MSAFARFLPKQPASRRAYSSFFSSKPGGGGRYFTSAKPPKVVVAPKTNVDQSPPAESTADSPAAAPTVKAAEQPSKPSSQPATTPSSDTPEAAQHTASAAPQPDLPFHLPNRAHHPLVNPKDFKLHQFFSLHRPLLLLSHPHSILDSAQATSFLPQPKEQHEKSSQWLLDEFPEASPDADAAAARQLTRALTMTHAGAAVIWEDTLRRLGLDPSKDADRVGLEEKMDKDWKDVMMDSTKRKRKKKMKKHKLKKLRKATRAQRLKIGR